MNLEQRPLPPDTVGLLEGLTTTRAIRRYRDEQIPDEALRAMFFAATRAPSGSNRQPFRFIVLTDGPNAAEAKLLLQVSARRVWEAKRQADGYEKGSAQSGSTAKSRMAETMQHYVDGLHRVPAAVLVCYTRHRQPHPLEGASVFPACQNLLLAARGLGYGGVMTGWHVAVEPELRSLLAIPEDVVLGATITLGRPEGEHGPVRRLALPDLVYQESWGVSAEWAVDPPGTRHTQAGPPSRTAV